MHFNREINGLSHNNSLGWSLAQTDTNFAKTKPICCFLSPGKQVRFQGWWFKTIPASWVKWNLEHFLKKLKKKKKSTHSSISRILVRIKPDLFLISMFSPLLKWILHITEKKTYTSVLANRYKEQSLFLGGKATKAYKLIYCTNAYN